MCAFGIFNVRDSGSGSQILSLSAVHVVIALLVLLKGVQAVHSDNAVTIQRLSGTGNGY